MTGFKRGRITPTLSASSNFGFPWAFFNIQVHSLMCYQQKYLYPVLIWRKSNFAVMREAPTWRLGPFQQASARCHESVNNMRVTIPIGIKSLLIPAVHPAAAYQASVLRCFKPLRWRDWPWKSCVSPVLRALSLRGSASCVVFSSSSLPHGQQPPAATDNSTNIYNGSQIWNKSHNLRLICFSCTFYQLDWWNYQAFSLLLFPGPSAVLPFSTCYILLIQR